MSLNVTLLRESFEVVITAAPDLTERFYGELFSRFPQLQPLFGRRSQKAQADMLAQALVAVLEHLEDPRWLTDVLGGLGAKHTGYGVTDEMYGMVGEALLATLEKAAGEAWTPELAAAWGEAFGAIAGLMQAGARRAAA
jgi:hemoglobin-like flavoprotein